MDELIGGSVFASSDGAVERDGGAVFLVLLGVEEVVVVSDGGMVVVEEAVSVVEFGLGKRVAKLDVAKECESGGSVRVPCVRGMEEAAETSEGGLEKV